MARRSHNNKNRPSRRSAAPPPPPLRTGEMEKKAPRVYAAPIIVLEDGEKKTFVFARGRWQPHTATIDECRIDCQVKELPQRINGMKRYEVCMPVDFQ